MAGAGGEGSQGDGLGVISDLFPLPLSRDIQSARSGGGIQAASADYETGIMRITRHPQMVGQLIWCVAHTLWLGTTFTLVTSVGLMLHHLFAVWHGDYRLTQRYGKDFETVKARTSIVPFLAVLDGRQQLKLTEFLRPAYIGVAAFVAVFWWGHPWLIEMTAKAPF